jgi:hypothetical protein
MKKMSNSQGNNTKHKHKELHTQAIPRTPNLNPFTQFLHDPKNLHKARLVYV